MKFAEPLKFTALSKIANKGPLLPPKYGFGYESSRFVNFHCSNKVFVLFKQASW